MAPTSLAEIPFYLIPGGGAAAAGMKTGTKVALRQAEKKVAKELMKKGMSKQAAKEYAKKEVAKQMAKQVPKAGINVAKQAAKKEAGKGFVKKAAPKFFSKKTPTLDKLLKGFKNVKGFKPYNVLPVRGGGLSKGIWAVAHNAFLSKHGYATTMLAIAAKGCGKNEACDKNVMAYIRAKVPEFDAASDADINRAKAEAHKQYEATTEKYNVLDKNIKSSKSADKVHDHIATELLETQKDGTQFTRDGLQRYHKTLSKEYGRARMGDFEDFLRKLEAHGLELTKLDENYNFIVESIMTRFGF